MFANVSERDSEEVKKNICANVSNKSSCKEKEEERKGKKEKRKRDSKSIFNNNSPLCDGTADSANCRLNSIR